VIAVQNLDAAMEVYRGIGFAVTAGGKHTGRGTHNAIVRFGLDYLELLAVYDEVEERAHGGELSDFLRDSGGGLVAFAVATAQIDELAARWTSSFAPVGAPEAMERIRPDGYRLSWRLLIPGGSPWHRPWPFVIQWDTPDADRLAHDAPASHPNGFSGVAGVTVATKSVERLLQLYSQDLGLEVRSQTADEAVLGLGALTVRLSTGPAERPTALELRTAEGTAPFVPPPGV